MKTRLLTLLLFLFAAENVLAQMELPQSPAVADSIRKSQQSLLHRNVPEIFKLNRLELRSFPDSSWQILRSDTLLPREELFLLMDAAEALDQFEYHFNNAVILEQQLRESRLISSIGGVGGSFYLILKYDSDWIQIVPGFLVVGFSIWKWYESRRIETAYDREIYFMNNVMPLYRLEQWVEDYNFKLYQSLSREPIHFREQ